MRKAVVPGIAILCGALVTASLGAQAARTVPAAVPPAPVTFKAATNSGIDFVHTSGHSKDKFLVETMGSGGLFFDFDNDGWLDVFLVDGGSFADAKVAERAGHRLYRNRGGGSYEDVTAAAGIRHRAYGMGACAGDYDNDGWVDLYVTNAGPNVLYRNRGDGTFADVSGTAGAASPLWSASCAFADFDRDGFLDLFVTNYVNASADHNPPCGDGQQKMRVYCHPLVFDSLPNLLYRNTGKGTFVDASAEAGLGGYRGNGLGVVVTDYDQDGWPDVFVANDGVPNFLFHNEGKGRFAEVGLLAGVAVAPDGKARAGMGTDAGDYDGDGQFDLIVTNLWSETHSLFRNMGDALFAYATAESGIGPPTLPFVGFGTAFFDYDNDADVDIAIVNGDVLDNTALLRAGSTHAQRRLLFRNMGGRRFGEIGKSAGVAFAAERVGRGLAVGDIDNDGDLDLLATNNGAAPDLLINHGGDLNHALLVRTVGTKSNRDGVGARLVLTAGNRTHVREVRAGSGYLGQSDMRVHFGLGRERRIDRLQIHWPSGHVDDIRSVEADRIVTVREGEGIVQQTPFSPAARGAEHTRAAD